MGTGLMSKQNWRTPKYILEWIEKQWGPITLDVAASKENAVAERCFTGKDDALVQTWRGKEGLVFCNPPFRRIMPWVTKAVHEVRAGSCGKAVMVLPANTSSDWFRVLCQHAHIVLVSPRVAFLHDDGRPRDKPMGGILIACIDRHTVAGRFRSIVHEHIEPPKEQTKDSAAAACGEALNKMDKEGVLKKSHCPPGAFYPQEGDGWHYGKNDGLYSKCLRVFPDGKWVAVVLHAYYDTFAGCESGEGWVKAERFGDGEPRPLVRHAGML